MTQALRAVALDLVARGKGILAADETVPTLTKRFDALGIESTHQSRRTYRQMLFTFPAAGRATGQRFGHAAGRTGNHHAAGPAAAEGALHLQHTYTAG